MKLYPIYEIDFCLNRCSTGHVINSPQPFPCFHTQKAAKMVFSLLMYVFIDRWTKLGKTQYQVQRDTEKIGGSINATIGQGSKTGPMAPVVSILPTISC